jgi:general secretion pathway protein H
MGAPAELGLRQMSRTASSDAAAATAGFVLLEVICTIAILALLYAIVLPALPLSTSRSRLEGYAVQTASLLKADRNAAIRRQVQVATIVDVRERTIRSGVTGQIVRLPRDVSLDGLLAARCNNRPAGSTIQFFPSGMSCGGTVALIRGGLGYEVRVNWLTGGIEIVARPA